jgi:hypothetical protein
LSQALARRLMDTAMPQETASARYARLAYWAALVGMQDHMSVGGNVEIGDWRCRTANRLTQSCRPLNSFDQGK